MRIALSGPGVLLSVFMLGGCPAPKATTPPPLTPTAPRAPIVMPSAAKPWVYPGGNVEPRGSGFTEETSDDMGKVVQWYSKRFPNLKWTEKQYSGSGKVLALGGRDSEAGICVGIRDRAVAGAKPAGPPGTTIRVFLGGEIQY